MEPSHLWKLGLAIALGVAILASASARPPRKPLPHAELRWPLAGALALYAVGLLALLEHQASLATWLLCAGVTVSALAAWLSRGGDPGGWPPSEDDPVDEQPPSDPDGVPGFDWAGFERDFRAYSERSRDPVASR